MREILDRGVVRRRLRNITDETRIFWADYQSEYRYHLLVERLRGRRGLIRTANRKFRRQCGLGLKGA
jgi:hypothetical protein